MIKTRCRMCGFELTANEGAKSVFCICCGSRVEIAQNNAPKVTVPPSSKPSMSAVKSTVTATSTNSKNSPYIFISYAHKDTSIVLPIIKGLKARGFRVWYDAGIEAGTEWPDYIAEKLLGSACIIAFLSKEYVESRNCKQEVEFAISENKDVLSVYLDDFSLPAGLRMRLGLMQAMFKSRFNSESDFISELAGARILEKCK